MKKTLSHFCMHVKNMDNAISFYRDKLGFEVEEQTDDWSELKLNDKISLALHRTDVPGSGIGFMVDDCEKATEKLKESGVEVIKSCDDQGDNIILTQFKDADGNILWMSQKK